jgi:hypothetical protein
MIKIKLEQLNQKRFINFNPNIMNLLSDSVWICGGSMRSIYNGSDIKDYDLFFKNSESAASTERKLEELGYIKIFVCPLGELTTFAKEDCKKVQVIKKLFYTSIEDCISTFDFNAACAGIDCNYFYFKKEFIKDNRKKIISINKLTFPSATISRLIKCKAHGFYVSSAIQDVTQKIFDRDPNIIDLGALYVD